MRIPFGNEAARGGAPMYLARFSCDLPPVHRDRAMGSIRCEAGDARAEEGLAPASRAPHARRGRRSAALQFEVEPTSSSGRATAAAARARTRATGHAPSVRSCRARRESGSCA